MPKLTPGDFRLLYYFAIAAGEHSLHNAANKLCISQPPLSRQIQRLEEILGAPLFVRHSRGLRLTPEGRKVLEITRPLLDMQNRVFAELDALAKNNSPKRALGFSTAFEQGVFARLEKRICAGGNVRLLRASSPKLVQEIKKGRLDAAFVALPVNTQGLDLLPLDHRELLLAVLPASWPEAGEKEVSLARLNGRPLFWFKSNQNEAFFDYMQGFFNYAGFKPLYLEEPREHDVLLARIASGEGMALWPASFAAIKRANVRFLPLTGLALPELRMGVVHTGNLAGILADFNLDMETVWAETDLGGRQG